MSEKDYLGIIKWFGNKRTGEEYGFIYNPEIKDVFIHKRNLTFEIKAIDIVKFKLIVSEKGKDRNEAFELNKISEDEYLQKLLECFLYWELDYDLIKDVQKQIFEISDNSNLLLNLPLRDTIDKFIETNLLEYINSKQISSVNLDSIYNTVKELFTEQSTGRSIFKKSSLTDNLIDYFANTSNRHVRLLGWLEGVLNNYERELVKSIYEFSDIYVRKNIIRRVNSNIILDLIDISVSTFEEISPVPSDNCSIHSQFRRSTPGKIEAFINELDQRDKEFSKKYLFDIYQKSSSNQKLELWIKWDGLEFTDDVKKMIIEKFKEFDDDKIRWILNRFNDLGEETLKEFLQEFLSKDLNALFGKNLKELLDRWKDTSFNNYYAEIIKALPLNRKMELWIEGYLDYLDLNEITRGFHELGQYYQEKSIKKILFYFDDKTRERITVFVDTILSKLKESSQDFEVLLSLNLISAKLKGEKMLLKDFIIQALHLIQSHTKSQFSTYNSGDLLETCTGRGVLAKNYGEWTLSKSSNVPERIIYCEGRKAIDKKTNKPILNEGRQFYWCKNKPCYLNEINRKVVLNTLSDEGTEKETWKNQKLFHILMKIDSTYKEENHSYYMGILNKFYNYLKHLKCRSCDSWLTPIVQSNLAYDRVNHFKCEKDGCDQVGVEIYISHCLNYRCNNIVDSRDSKQCSYGWYICNYCFGCCSTEKLQVRKEIRTKTNQGYDGPEKGHDELEKIFCYNCGHELFFEEKSIVLDRIKQIFNSLYEITGLEATSSGEKKNGKKWILVTLESHGMIQDLYSKIKPLEADGIIINENDSGNGYFINEPISDNFHHLSCPNEDCNFNLYLESIYSSDKEKFNALRYHKKIDLLFRE